MISSHVRELVSGIPITACRNIVKGRDFSGPNQTIIVYIIRKVSYCGIMILKEIIKIFVILSIVKLVLQKSADNLLPFPKFCSEGTVVGDYINTIKMTFDFNFDLYQAVKHHEYT